MTLVHSSLIFPSLYKIILRVLKIAWNEEMYKTTLIKMYSQNTVNNRCYVIVKKTDKFRNKIYIRVCIYKILEFLKLSESAYGGQRK